MAGTHAKCNESNCPPADAQDCNGNYYHLCHNDPISPDGDTLLTAKENNKYPGVDPCLRCGISVFPTAADCVEHFKAMSQKIRAKWRYIAKGALKPEHGFVKHTPRGNPKSKHHTWWPSDDIADRFPLFNVIQPT